VKAIRKLAAKLKVSPEYLERGLDVSTADERELRLSETELTLRFGGDPVAAEKVLGEILESSQNEGDKPAIARAHIALGRLAYGRDDNWKALWHFEQALATEEISAVEDQQVIFDLASAYRATEMPERAEALLGEMLEQLEKDAPADVALRVRYTALLSLAQIDSGQGAEVGKALIKVAQELRSSNGKGTLAQTTWLQAQRAIETHRYQTALRKMRKALALLEVSEAHNRRALTHIMLAEALIESGEKKQAHEELALAEEITSNGHCISEPVIARLKTVKELAKS
jgi:tetratricopeptide (TPR) repeat protein